MLARARCDGLESLPESEFQETKSFLQCYKCIREESIKEIAAQRAEEEQRVKAKAEQEKREEETFLQSRKMAAEKAKKEGGLWLDVRKKGKKGGA
jgi:DNA-directed RNA polymerase subunit M/transcription elongation factor TFIIS